MSIQHLTLLTGVLCQSFTAPTGEICPGDDVTFTCIAGTSTTLWTVTSGGNVDTCVYRTSDTDNTDTCGPERRFTSSQTEISEDINNSSLSVDNIDVTIDLTGTLVECVNGNANNIGSYIICIAGSKVPKTVDTRRHCKVWLRACNDLPQPPNTSAFLHLQFLARTQVLPYF